jgi:16S rRNA (guanine527-N7)-methyltransferase
MNLARITELLQPFLSSTSSPICHCERSEEPAVLSPDQLHSISAYLNLLLRWNTRLNLTAVREPEHIVTRHFGESLFAACHLFPGDAYVETAAPNRASVGMGALPVQAERSSAEANSQPLMLDLGSGAGFPGVPIKIWAPAIHLTLIESNQKKATFLREVARHLGLTAVEVFSGRAEAYAGVSADVVTLRAVESFGAVLPTSVRLLGSNGRLVLLIGQSQCALAKELAPGLRWDTPIPIPLSARRFLLTGTRME